jgi:hypothetical protein
LFNLPALAAIPLAAGVYLAPFLLSDQPSACADGLGMVYRENIRRFFNSVNHRGPVYLYLYALVELFAPWALLLPAALVLAHRRGGDRFALSYFWSVFLFFTLSSSRRSYYLLPIVPAAALLVARLLACSPAEWTAPVRRLVPAAGVLLALAVLAAPLGFLWSSWWNLPPLPCPEVFACAWGLSALAVVFLWTGRIATAWGWVASLAAAYVFLFAGPAADTYRTQKGFAGEVRGLLGERADGLALYHTNEIVYYLDPGGPLPEFRQPELLRQAVRDRGLRYVILRQRHRQAVGAGARELARERAHPWESEALAGNKLLLLEVCSGD